RSSPPSSGWAFRSFARRASRMLRSPCRLTPPSAVWWSIGARSPGIVATQSTHEQLASFSQASQIHLKDSHIRAQRRRVEHRRFNQSFLQHASTSPFYPLFASLDVGAQTMKGRSGEVLWDDTIRLGIELRKKLRAVRNEFERREQDPARRWFF